MMKFQTLLICRYKAIAKNHKEQERLNLANKFDASGRSLLSLEEERLAEKRKNEKMLKEINEIVEEETIAKNLPQRKFFILHINTLVEVILVLLYVYVDYYALILFQMRDYTFPSLKTYIRSFLGRGEKVFSL